MEKYFRFSDERLDEFCALCGFVGADAMGRRRLTREHAVPKVLLDSPYPDNVPIVGSCSDCNHDLSLDEEYTACAIEVARLGTAMLVPDMRTKVARTLGHSPALATRLAAAIVTDETGSTALRLESDRLTRVFDKIARCLWAFECSEPSFAKCDLSFGSIHMMSDPELQEFLNPSAESPGKVRLLPEIGSRAFSRTIFAMCELASSDHWQTVHSERFRYFVDPGAEQRNVRFVIGEYVAVCATVHATT